MSDFVEIFGQVKDDYPKSKMTKKEKATLALFESALKKSQAENAALKEQVAQLESRNFNLTLELEKDKEQTSNLVRVLNEMNGPSHIGEPVYPYRHAILESLENQLTTLQSKSAALVDALGKIGNPVESCENCDRSCDTDKYPCHSCNKNGWSKGESFWKPQGHIVDSRAALVAFKEQNNERTIRPSPGVSIP